ncbi:MAG: DUF1328 domain-containing protein [Candidatus Eremiobacteraeota bacterium]|nr:DUF1328 domain-containing protein [Candidatus Eremiobacteraeota bacterium]
MIKLAVLALIVALVAGAFGLPGVSEFALGISKLLISVVGLAILLVALLAVYFYRKVRGETRLFKA